MMRQGRVMDPEPHPDVEAIKPGSRALLSWLMEGWLAWYLLQVQGSGAELNAGGGGPRLVAAEALLLQKPRRLIEHLVTALTQAVLYDRGFFLVGFQPPATDTGYGARRRAPARASGDCADCRAECG